MIELRPYQIQNAAKGTEILKQLNIVYLAMEVRTGKTLTSLAIAKDYGAKNVLFLTKKKAIPSIEKDYKTFNPGFNLIVINIESMHKIEDPKQFDLVIKDEMHTFGAYPKPGVATKQFKKVYGHLPHIYLSGTPTPESYSQIYHQFWVSKFSPFSQTTFYKWAKEYVNVTQRHLSHGVVNDYSDARIDLIAPVIEPYMIRFTQAEAGFKSVIEEEIIWVQPSQQTLHIIDKLRKDLVIIGKEHNITADTAVSLQSKLHQLYSGTILFDEIEGQPRHSMVLDTTKAETIKQKFSGQKIVIFYKFQAELKALLDVLGDSVTSDINEFRTTNKSIALQIVSGREGLDLSAASAIVFYTPDFSATSYWQARDRMTTATRENSKIYWVFCKNGIEEKVYSAVVNKKDYTMNMFKRDFGISKNARKSDTKQFDQTVRESGILCS